LQQFQYFAMIFNQSA